MYSHSYRVLATCPAPLRSHSRSLFSAFSIRTLSTRCRTPLAIRWPSRRYCPPLRTAQTLWTSHCSRSELLLRSLPKSLSLSPPLLSCIHTFVHSISIPFPIASTNLYSRGVDTYSHFLNLQLQLTCNTCKLSIIRFEVSVRILSSWFVALRSRNTRITSYE